MIIIIYLKKNKFNRKLTHITKLILLILIIPVTSAHFRPEEFPRTKSSFIIISYCRWQKS